MDESNREIGCVNIDTGTAIAFVSQASPTRHRLKANVQDKQMVMTQTAEIEFRNVLSVIAGPQEAARGQTFLNRVKIIADNPSVRAMDLIETKK